MGFTATDFYSKVDSKINTYYKKITTSKTKTKALLNLKKLQSYLTSKNKNYKDSSKSFYIQTRLTAFNPIQNKLINSKRCTSIKSEIRVTYDPQFNKLTKVPSYVKQALTITDYICKL